MVATVPKEVKHTSISNAPTGSVVWVVTVVCKALQRTVSIRARGSGLGRGCRQFGCPNKYVCSDPLK